MSYEEIFILGWNLNILMFVINFIIALTTMTSKPKEQLFVENKILTSLKNEFDKYYPYRKYETLVIYFIPFAAFFKMCYRIIEMYFFFSRNRGTKMFDYMIYKYQSDIELAKNRLK